MAWSDPSPRTGHIRGSVTSPQHRVQLVAAAILIAVVAMLAWSWLVRTVIVPAWLQAVGAYLVVWVPLGVAVVLAARGARRAGAPPPWSRPLFRPIDLLWGVGVAFVMRGVAAGIELAILGRMSGTGLQLEIDPALAWFVLLAAPVLIGPVVEEFFFRGVTLPALRGATDASGARRSTSTAISLIVSALVFAALHTLESASPALALVTALSTFAFGLAAGCLVVFTGRLGAALVAHVGYNGLLMVLLVS